MGKQLKKKGDKITEDLDAILMYDLLDTAYFIDPINPVHETSFVINYTDLKIKGLVKEFIIDFKNFKNIISANNLKKYCKFYFIQNDGVLNIGMSFSDNEDLPIKNEEDILYELQKTLFVNSDFSSKKDDFSDTNIGLGYKIEKKTGKKTEMILYELVKIEKYISDREADIKMESLKFIMFLHTDIIGYKDRIGRISFSVHAIGNELTAKSPTVDFGYDFGNLKP